MEEEQVVPDKIETKLKTDLKMMGYKNGMEKDVTLVIKKQANILIIKRDLHRTKRVTWIIFLCWDYKRLVKVLKHFLRRDKEKKTKRTQVL